ncbi:MAG: cell division protein SepF [Bacillota bacterium]|nr:cell division protein SepF [Bacillota bacterium]
MNKLWRRMMEFLGLAAEEEEEEYDEVGEEFPPEPGRWRSGRLVSLPARAERPPLKVFVVQSSKFDDVQGMVDHLKSRSPVVANLSGADYDTARRMVDFLTGAVYALNGSVHKVTDGIFLFAPENVEIHAEDVMSLKEHGLFFLAGRG